MIVLDLFSGLGGFSQAFKDRGHSITTVDNNSEFNPTVCMDVNDFLLFLDMQFMRKKKHNLKDISWEYVDIILASPPCTEFSKDSMPRSWHANPNPNTKLLEDTLEIIKLIKPKWWVIENVRGAVKWFMPIIGPFTKKVGSRYLWGEFPIFDCKDVYGKWNLPPSKDRPALRSLIPYELSLALCIACEQDPPKEVPRGKGLCSTCGCDTDNDGNCGPYGYSCTDGSKWRPKPPKEDPEENEGGE